MSKKIYSKRFSTDCFSDFFTEKALRSPVGIDDLPEYSTEKATFDELSEQNSYFINDLLNGLKNNDKKNWKYAFKERPKKNSGLVLLDCRGKKKNGGFRDKMRQTKATTEKGLVPLSCFRQRTELAKISVSQVHRGINSEAVYAAKGTWRTRKAATL